MKTFIINEQQEKLILKEFVQFGFSLGKLDTLDFNNKIAYCNEYLGKPLYGGYRATYEYDDDKVLKLALNEDKIFQNKTEYEMGIKLGKKFPLLFPKVYLHAEDFSWIVVEKILPFEKEDCITLLGIPYSSSFSDYAKTYNNAKKNYAQYMTPNQTGVEMDYDEDVDTDLSLEGFIEWCENISNDEYDYIKDTDDEIFYGLIDKNPWFKTLYRYITSLKGVTDIFADNLGLALRNGQPYIVILDNGFEELK